jgi:hypothetical protein
MRIVNDVKWEVGLEAYEAATARFVELCEECGIGRDRVGFFGEVSFPGVSDLDAVVTGGGPALAWVRARHREEVRISEPYGYVFWHEPLWILEEVAGDAQVLHTMEGLKRADGKEGAFVPGIPPEEGRRVLNVAWLISLLWIVADLKRQGSAGLRLLLLVHKNLHHSMHAFGSDAGARGETLMGAAELRDWARQHRGREDCAELARMVWAQVLGALTAACRAMDAVCGGMPESGGVGARWILTRRIIFRRGAATTFDAEKGRIGLNAYAFMVAKGHLNGRAVCPELRRYLEAEGCSRRAYERVGLEYPFIDPIPVAPRGWRRFLTRGVNRLADALWGVF